MCKGGWAAGAVAMMLGNAAAKTHDTTQIIKTNKLKKHGDCGVGFRDGDDEELTRWAAKQRSARR